MNQQPTLFESGRLTMQDSIRLTAESLNAYGPQYPHWAIAYSGGKDSSATVTLVAHLIDSGQVAAPESLTLLYADTRMELPPLHASALGILESAETKGIHTRMVLPPLDERFFVYMLGRGVPPPKNRFRWCTSQIKIEPMLAAIEAIAVGLGYGERVTDEKTGRTRYQGNGTGKLLMLTGVRIGESAARDLRILTSCSRDGAECGQGWFQESTPVALADTLAPLLHWRVCHVWDWLMFHAPDPEHGGWPTVNIAEAYGGDEAQEINARTGCIGCPLASRDAALDAILKSPHWTHLAPLKRLRPLYEELWLPRNRLRQPAGERRQDGTLTSTQHRMGPLTLKARQQALAEILTIQAEVNGAAAARAKPPINILNWEEENRIRELIALNTWPRRWTGAEPRADAPFAEHGQQLLMESDFE